MIYLEIAMIIIGLGAIIFGVKMSEGDASSSTTGTKTDWTKENKIWKEKLQEYKNKLSTMEEDAVLNTEERLNTISNEKIMGINEYSDQVLDKIEKNHGEVVFLYNMLEEKKIEIQKMIQDADVTKAEFRDELAQSYKQSQELANLLKQELEEDASPVKKEHKKNNKEQEKVSDTEDLTKDKESESASDNPSEKKQDKKEEKSISSNKNDEIIRLHEKGHSVIEISKMLSIGQGEVKLVLDLFQ